MGGKRGRARRSKKAGSGSRRQTQLAGLQLRWAASIPNPEWQVYLSAIAAFREAGLTFMVGGGFAFAAFTGRWRDTKDIDFYIRPQDRQRAIGALGQAGFVDYFRRKPYDRQWIYRSTRSGVIVDVIWSMANQRAEVDESWFARSRFVRIRGEKLSLLPLEEMIWCKLYILQRDRCDWTDVFNLIFAAGEHMNWDVLIDRLEDDLPLLQSVLTVYSWVCPEKAAALPDKLWRRLRLHKIRKANPSMTRRRVRLLDSRGWFAGLQPEDRKLEI